MSQSRFDVVVSGSTGDTGRATVLEQLSLIREIERSESDRFVAGEPLRILTNADEREARALAAQLQMMGALVAVEPSPAAFVMPSDISLMALDGEDSTPEPAEPQLFAPAVVEHAPVAVKADVFSAPPVAQVPMELELAPPPPPVRVSTPGQTFAPSEEERAETDGHRPVPGRLFQGKLREQPAVRLLIGVGLGLLLGYGLSAPLASRAEKRVAAMRAEANVDRWRPTDEARANAARLDEAADDTAASAFTKTLLIWLGTAGLVTAGWHRIT